MTPDARGHGKSGAALPTTISQAMSPAWWRRLLATSRDEALADARRRHPHRSREIVELVTDARLRTPVQAFDVLIPPNSDYREVVGAIRAPVLLVVGDDGAVSPKTARRLQALNARLRCDVIPGAGHGLPYDQPDAFAASVGAFLRETLAP